MAKVVIVRPDIPSALAAAGRVRPSSFKMASNCRLVMGLLMTPLPPIRQYLRLKELRRLKGMFKDRGAPWRRGARRAATKTYAPKSGSFLTSLLPRDRGRGPQLLR